MGRGKPMVTYVIIGVCVAFFLLQQVAPQPVAQWLMFAPAYSIAEPWTFITSGFLHGGVMHLVLNLWALWAVGQYLEQTLGHARYAGLFLVSVIAGHTAVLLLASPYDSAWITGTVGASGGIFGLFGALFVVNRRMGAQATQVIILIVLNLVITFAVPGISWQGHLGGAVRDPAEGETGSGPPGSRQAIRPDPRRCDRCRVRGLPGGHRHQGRRGPRRGAAPADLDPLRSRSHAADKAGPLRRAGLVWSGGRWRRGPTWGRGRWACAPRPSRLAPRAAQPGPARADCGCGRDWDGRTPVEVDWDERTPVVADRDERTPAVADS
jgi:membrane associated rhomboid family serine protease